MRRYCQAAVVLEELLDQLEHIDLSHRAWGKASAHWQVKQPVHATYTLEAEGEERTLARLWITTMNHDYESWL